MACGLRPTPCERSEPMIKLIASDLDGSLLNDEKELPADFWAVQQKLNKKGIRFVVASGRDFDATANSFDRRVENSLWICNNGANIYKDGVEIISHSLTKDQVKRTLDVVKTIPDTVPILFTSETSFTCPGCEGFMEWAKAPYSKMEWVDCFDELYNIPGDIFKISVYDGSGNIENYSYPPIAAEFKGECGVYISGDIWVDIVNLTASKGNALKEVQEMLGVTKEETMAFGDYYNDESLLDAAGYPFVMERGVDLLKNKFPLRAGDNNKGGVTQTIKEFLGL